MIKKLAAFTAGWCFIIAAIVFAIETVAFNKSYYADFYKTNRLDEKLDTSLDDINFAMGLMLDYLQDERQDLKGEITVHGLRQEVYNARETAHMADVKNLYQHARLAGWISLGLMAAIIIFFRVRYGPGAWVSLGQGFKDAALCALFLLAFLGLWAATNFTDFWIHFHELFFSNDLWLLNPETDFMIRICPESMFYKLVFDILIRFLVIFLPVELLAVIYSTRKV